MLQFPIIINNNLCKSTETVQREKINNANKAILAYIHNAQHATAVDHQLDQVKE